MHHKIGRRSGELERAIVECARRLASAHPRYPASAFRAAEHAISRVLARDLLEGVVGDLVALLSEVAVTREPASVFGEPGVAALQREEFLLLSALAALQGGDLCRALSVLSDMLQDTRVGRLLFPLKFLATRLQLSGVWVTPIGERAFAVFSSDIPDPRRTPARAHLTLARTAG